MKKQILLCISFIVVCIHSSAQYNRTFYTNYLGNPLDEYASDIVDAGNGNVGILSRIAQGSTENGFTIKELDVNGGINFNNTFNFSTTTVGYVTATTLIRTASGDYMVAGYVGDATATNPFAASISGTGNLYWFEVFKSNSGHVSAIHKVGLTRAWDDWSTVAYLLVACGDDTVPVGSLGGASTDPTNQSINVIKFSAASGLIWNKKYFDLSFSGPVSSWQPYPETIAYGEDDNSHAYFIAGSATYTLNSINKEEGFHMAINGNGTIITGTYNDYASYTIPTYSFGQSAIYDAGTEEFILTYTLANNTLTSNSAVVSEMGVSKIGFSSLDFNSTDIYYEDVPCSVSENYSFDIKEDATGNNYILGGFVSRSDVSGTVATATLLKIDKLGAVQAFKRYNTATHTYASVITNTVDALSNEYYVLATHANLSNTYKVRALSTNTLGETCGHDDINYGTMSYTYFPQSGTLITSDLALDDVFYSPDSDDDVTYTDCDPVNPQYKDATGIGKLNYGTVNVYPTILSPDEQYVTIEMPGEQQQCSLQLYSIDGKKVKSEQLQYGDRQARISWNTGLTSAGVYMLKLEFRNPAFNKVVKITKQ